MASIQLQYSSNVFVPALLSFVSYKICTRVTQVAAEHFKWIESSPRLFEYGLTLTLIHVLAIKTTPLIFKDNENYVHIAFAINLIAIAIISAHVLWTHIISRQDDYTEKHLFAEELTRLSIASRQPPQAGFDDLLDKIDGLLKRPANQSIVLQADHTAPYPLLILELARRIHQKELPANSALEDRPLFYLHAAKFAGSTHEAIRAFVRLVSSKNGIVVIDKFELMENDFKWVWQQLEHPVQTGKIVLIGVTAPEHYSKLITAIPSLQQLNRLEVSPFNAENCFLALKKQLRKFQQYRPGITITDEAFALATLFSYHYVVKGFSLADASANLSDVIQKLQADSKALDGETFTKIWYELYEQSPLKLSLASIPAPSVQFLNSKNIKVEEQMKATLEVNKKKKEARADTRDVPTFMTDMVEMAREGRYAPCIGRDEEIDTVLGSLRQSQQKSLVFTGPPGIGKSAVFEELARRIALQDPSVKNLQDLLVYEVNVTALLSTEGYLGQLHTKVEAMINFCKKRPGQVVLVIDELHQLRGAGRHKGNENDLFEMLKNALARDEVIVLGTTNNYRWDPIAKEDPAINRRIKPVEMAPPSADICKTMLIESNKLGFYTKDAPLVKLSDEAIAHIVDETDKIRDRHFPDKATVLISEIVSFYQIQQERAGNEQITIGVDEVKARLEKLQSR